jgi:L-xylulokinase
MSKYIIAIDRGSTNVKAVVFDKAGNEVFVSSVASQKPVSVHPGWWEQDMNIMWEGTVQAIKGVFENSKCDASGQSAFSKRSFNEIKADDILGVIVTGQGNGLMPVDKNGNPSRMGILSLDSRGAEIHNSWMADGRYMQAAQIVGMPFPAGSPLPLLSWFEKNQPEEFSKIDKILFSKDWIRFKLSGTLCTDQTDASGAGLMALAKNDYAWDVFNLLGLKSIKDKLPTIVPSHTVVGAVTRGASLETGLREGTPVLCGAHDIAAYPFGVGTLDSKELVTVVGTWGLNLIATKSLEGAIAALYHCVPGYFITGLGDGNSGGCLDIIVDTICQNEKYQAAQFQKSVYEVIEEEIEKTKPSSIIFQPYIFGSLMNSSASAGFCGIKNWHTKADIMRAVYDGIVMGHYAYVQMIPGHESFKSMWLIGGGAKSKVFGQIFADITGLTVKTTETHEITARGGALNALVGLGICKSHEDACISPEISKLYEPNFQRHEFYQKKFGIFNQLSQTNAEVWSTLNEMNKN